MKYLGGEEVLVIHSEIIDQTGGSHGVRDINLFKSILEKPKMSFGGNELYPDLFLKAAVYLEAFATYHVFVDGNKRTALAATARFLYLNRHEFKTTNKEMEEFILKAAVKKLGLKDIAFWLKNKSRKI